MQAAVDEWQEENVKETESKAHYKNMAPKRPVCQKLEDHITLGVSRFSSHDYRQYLVSGCGISTFVQ